MPDHQLLRSRFLTVYPRATSKSPASSRAHQWPGRGRRHGKRPELERAGIRRPDARPAVERHRLGDATGTMRSPQRAERGHLGRGSAVSAVNATLRTRARRICGRSVRLRHSIGHPGRGRPQTNEAAAIQRPCPSEGRIWPQCRRRCCVRPATSKARSRVIIPVGGEQGLADVAHSGRASGREVIVTSAGSRRTASCHRGDVNGPRLRAAVVHPGGDADGRRRLVGPNARTIAIYFDGSDDPEQAEDGTPYSTTTSVVLVKSWWEPLGFTLPPHPAWRGMARRDRQLRPRRSRWSGQRHAGDQVTVGPRSVAIFRPTPLPRPQL